MAVLSGLKWGLSVISGKSEREGTRTPDLTDMNKMLLNTSCEMMLDLIHVIVSGSVNRYTYGYCESLYL